MGHRVMTLGRSSFFFLFLTGLRSHKKGTGLAPSSANCIGGGGLFLSSFFWKQDLSVVLILQKLEVQPPRMYRLHSYDTCRYSSTHTWCVYSTVGGGIITYGITRLQVVAGNGKRNHGLSWKVQVATQQHPHDTTQRHSTIYKQSKQLK